METIQYHQIKLLDCQVEIILKCLEYYCYSANFMFDRNKKYTTKEDNIRISIITDTYEQISLQFANSKSNNKMTNYENQNLDILKKVS
jgi:hypothetical protein